MASMQRRLGPNSVGWYGLLQAFKGKHLLGLHTTRLLYNKSGTCATNVEYPNILHANTIKGLYNILTPIKVFYDK
jgi:hypothetical protein